MASQKSSHGMEKKLNELEEQLRESERRFHVLFEQVAVGIAFVGIEGQWLKVNQKLCEIVGYTQEELLELTFQHITYPDDLVIDLEYVRKLLADELPTYTLEKRYLRKDTTLIWINLTVSLVRDAAGVPQHFIAVVEDINRRKEAEIETIRLLEREKQGRLETEALERRTQQALEGLLVMAKSLIELPENTDEEDRLGRQLVALACSVLGCRRASIHAIEQGTQIMRPLAVVGLGREEEQQWWTEQQRQRVSLYESSVPAYVECLRKNEVVVLDMTQPPLNEQPNPYQIQIMLAAPLCIGERLMGVMTLDYGALRHEYSESEIVLASAVAKLSALIIERQRLLSERADAQGRELALREANNRMEEFLGVASHELRTPLTTIKANIQLAIRRLKTLLRQKDDLTEDIVLKASTAQEMLTRAERQVGVLNRLVGDLIDISRIQAGRLQLHLRKEPCDLVSLVQEAVQEQRKAVPGRTIELSLPEIELLQVHVDPDRIVQVLTNYLSNALKYSTFDKPVGVQLIVRAQEASSACVIVRDYGPGLAEEEQQRVWECFYQSQDVKVLSGSGVGLGLGLHISRTLIERHGGRVGVDSTPGEGSAFWFTLPLVEETEL